MPCVYYNNYLYMRFIIIYNILGVLGLPIVRVTDLIKQVSQLLRAGLKELVDMARAIIEPIEPYDEE